MESTTYSNESGKDIARTRYVWLDYSKVLCIAGVSLAVGILKDKPGLFSVAER